MANVTEEQQVEAKHLARVVNLLGGRKVLGHELKTALEAHEMLIRGLPGPALTHLMHQLKSLPGTVFLNNAVGMSLRTVQRRSSARPRPLSRQQSGQTWKFAELLAKATEVFGSQEEAEEWLQRPATGLNQRRPIDLLATPAGVKLVEDFLTRLEYGVYV